MTPGAQERAYDRDPARAIATMLGKLDDEDKHTFNSLIAQAVQAAYEHAAEIAQSHQCPHGWHSCGGDIAAALRARPTEPTGEKG